MVAYPVPRTWTDGEIPPVDTMNTEFYTNAMFLLSPPMVRLRQTSAQSVAYASWTAITWDTEDSDTYGMHSATYPSRIVPMYAGYYVGSFGGTWDSRNDVYDTYGRRMVAVRLNGTAYTTFRTDSRAPITVNANLCMKSFRFGPQYFNGTTDYCEVVMYQTSSSGISINTEVGSTTTDTEEQSEFYMRWVRSA